MNWKIRTPGQNEKLSFINLIYQIQNGLKNFFQKVTFGIL